MPDVTDDGLASSTTDRAERAALVRIELRDTRQRGYVRLDGEKGLPKIDTPLLERAARSIPAVGDKATRVEAIRHLLEREVPQLDPPFDRLLVVLFGLRTIADNFNIESETRKNLIPNEPGSLLDAAVALSGHDKITFKHKIQDPALKQLAERIARRYSEYLVDDIPESEASGQPQLRQAAPVSESTKLDSSDATAQPSKTDARQREAARSMLEKRLQAKNRTSIRKRRIRRTRLALFALTISVALIAALTTWLSSGEESPEAATDDSLLITMTQLHNSPAYRLVFPSDKMAEAGEFLDEDGTFNDMSRSNGNLDLDDIVGQQLTAGAYAEGYLNIHLNLQTSLPQQVTIYNTRVIEREVAEAVDGWYGDLSPGGADEPDRIVIRIGETNPVAYAVTQKGNHYVPTDTRFFDRYVINVAPGAKESVIIDTRTDFDAHLPGRSYEFKLAVDYEVDGHKHTQVVDNDGQPFRVTERACQYQAMSMPNFTDPDYSPNFKLVRADPDDRYIKERFADC